jgi:hypothetical protein
MSNETQLLYDAIRRAWTDLTDLAMKGRNKRALTDIAARLNASMELASKARENDRTDYWKDARSDACETADNFFDEIVENLVDDGEASDDLNNDYSRGDEWHHSCHVDKSYDLYEAADLLRQLSEYRETDSGLWEGKDPEDAIEAQAAYTYAAAVYDAWRDLIKDINEAYEGLDLDELETEYETNRERIDELENEDELTDAERAELVELRKGKWSEDDFDAEKKRRIEAMVREQINGSNPYYEAPQLNAVQ